MKSEIRLKGVRITNLFGRLSYDIRFDTGANVAIVIAPNGCGKTTIFKLINFIFAPDFAGVQVVRRIPFDKCECLLSNGKSVILTRTGKPGNGVPNDLSVPVGLSLSVTNGGKSLGKYSYPKIIIPRMPQEYLEDLEWRYGDIQYRGDYYDTRILAEERRRFEMVISAVEELLSAHGCKIDVNFITADRLHSLRGYSKSLFPSWRRRGEECPRDPLSLIQGNIRKLYAEILDEYNARQQQLKDRLPKMYLERSQCKMDFETFRARWTTYVTKIEKFCEIGLIPSSQTILAKSKLKDAYDRKSTFLEVYLEAFEQTLPPLEKHYERLKLFVDILNRRNQVTNKVLRYGETGLVMKMDDTPLDLNCLSSGEKNDLIMFYNLVFGSRENGLVLVDEPEISLHIEWQVEYLDCLLKICEMNRLQSIVATHSPSIVNGHFELYANMDVRK